METRMQSSALLLNSQRFTWFVGVGEPEVHDLESFVKVNKQVLRLQVSVYYAQLVQILNPCDELPEVLASLGLFEPLLLDNAFKQFSLRYILHNKEELFGRFDDLIELDDIGMPDLFENVYFPGHSLHIGHIHDLALLQHLHRHLLARRRMDAQFDLPEGALSEVTGEDVVADFASALQGRLHFLLH